MFVLISALLNLKKKKISSPLCSCLSLFFLFPPCPLLFGGIEERREESDKEERERERDGVERVKREERGETEVGEGGGGEERSKGQTS